MSLSGAVTRAVSRKGVTATIRKTSAGTYNTATRSYTGETVSTYTVKGIKEPFKREQAGGSGVVFGDIAFWMDPAELAAAGVTLAQGDFIEIGSKRYRVEDLQSGNEAESTLYIMVHLRGVE